MDVKIDEFIIDGTRLILADRIDTSDPSRSERILWIAGSLTGAYYSSAPLSQESHELLCFTYCADVLKTMKPDPFNRALVLGCGGCAIPRWLLEEYPSVSVDVVDRSQEMIDICRKYFMQRWDDSDRLKYFCDDAGNFEPENKYEFIFCDLFDGEELAPVVYDPDFAISLSDMVSDNGILVINCGWADPGTVKEIYEPAFSNLQIMNRKFWQTQVLIARP